MIPIKTKIAGWWMKVWGALCFVIGILSYIEKKKDIEMGHPSYFFLPPYVVYPFICLIIGSLYLLFSHFLLQNKKWAWTGAIIFLSINGILGMAGVYFLFLSFTGAMTSLNLIGVIFFLLIIILALLPLVADFYLLFDKKNYWKNDKPNQSTI